MGHAQLVEDLARHLILRLAILLLDDRAQEDERQVAVEHLAAPRLHEIEGEQAVYAFVARFAELVRPAVWDEAGRVGEQVPQGHFLDRRAHGPVEHFGHGVVQRELAVLKQFQDGGPCARHLGERGDVEAGVLGHGIARGQQLRPAVGLVQQRFAPAARQQHGAGELLFFNGLFDLFVEQIKALHVHHGDLFPSLYIVDASGAGASFPLVRR